MPALDKQDIPATLAAKAPPGQAARLAALRSYGILDTPVEGAFEDITRIAAHVCGTPIAVVNLIDEERQWFKSEIGLGVRETPLASSICAHALLEAELMEIPDTRLDGRFRCNPLVTGEPHLRFYAGALLRDSAGHALGTVCVLDTRPRTLTDEQRGVLRALARQAMGQLELRRALIRAERGRRYRSRLMAVAGHDLMQPLSVLTIVIEEMRRLRATHDPDEQLELASAAASSLARDLTRLAQASRDDADREDVAFVNLALDEVLQGLRETWSFAGGRKGLEMAFGHCDLHVRSHPAMLRTVLDNLVGNAVKYTASGGVRVDAVSDQEGVRVDVADSGIGMDQATLGRIFEEFQQVDPTSEGLGLGLSIVKRTADLLGCRLSVRSERGAGSTFSLWIPGR